MPKPTTDAQQNENQRIEALEKEKQALLRKLTEQARLADFDKLARAVSHEFNNFLNVLLLQVAVLEQELPNELRGDLGDIRRQAGKVAAAVKQLQQYRQQCQGVMRPLDLNEAITNAVESLPRPRTSNTQNPSERPGLRLALAAELPQVLASEQALKRLCQILAELAASVSSKGSETATIATSLRGQYAAVDISAPAATRSVISDAAQECQPLVTELQGKIQRAGEGNLTVELLAVPGEANAQVSQ